MGLRSVRLLKPACFLFSLFLFDLQAARADDVSREQAQTFAKQNAEATERSYFTLQGLLEAADPVTLLVPDHFHDNPPPNWEKKNKSRVSPFHSMADCYGYMVICSYMLDPELYKTRMLEMLRNEMRYTNVQATIPAMYSIKKRVVGPPSFFGAAEYAKDGLISISELVGDSPWFWRMQQMIADVMERAPIKTKYGMLPSDDAELNGDILQVLPRLYWWTGDVRFRDWARQIADAYFFEVLPGSNWLPVEKWNFQKGKGNKRAHLRDHGNEAFVGLVLVYVMEDLLNSDRKLKYQDAVRKMLDRLLASTTADGFYYDIINVETLEPIGSGLVDNWGYLYGAVYNFYLATGEQKYRDAVLKVLSNLPKYKDYPWEGNHYDGYADSIESAIYLVNREPTPPIFDWIDSEMHHIWDQQQADGNTDQSYLQGNFIRTSLLYAWLKSKGLFVTNWRPGIGVGAVVEGSNLVVHIRDQKQVSKIRTGPRRFTLKKPQKPKSVPWQGELKFDGPRHFELFNLPKNFVRLNEFPEWFTVTHASLWELARPDGKDSRIVSGAELRTGVPVTAGDWVLKPWVSEIQVSADTPPDTRK